MKRIFLLMLLFYSLVLLGQEIVWDHHLAGDEYSYTSYQSILDTEDGGCLTLAYVEFYDDPQGRFCALRLIRYDSNGDVVLQRDYLNDWVTNYNNRAKIIRVDEGGYVIMASCIPDTFDRAYVTVFKIDFTGDIIWSYNFGENHTRFLYGKDIIQNNEGGFTIAISDKTDENHIFPMLVSITETGEFQWERLYNDINRNFYITSLVQEPFGDYFFTGNIETIASGEMAFTVTHTDAAGIFISRQDYRTSNYNYGIAIKRLFDGNFVLAGYTGSTVDGEAFAPFLYLINEAGEVIWEEDYLEYQNYDNRMTGFFVNDAYNFVIMASYEGTYPYIFEVNRYNTQIDWDIDFIDDALRFTDMIQTNDGMDNYFITIGNTWYNGQVTGYIMKLKKNVADTQANSIIPTKEKIQVYPNPFNPQTTISFSIQQGENGILSIYNLKGEKLLSKEFSSGFHKFVWDASNYVSGTYFYQLKTSQNRKIGKMILLK